MDRDWLRTYLFRMAVDRRYLSEEQLQQTGLTPEPIPYWNLY